MKKALTTAAIVVLFVSTLAFLSPPKVEASESMVFQDDFESYGVGSFPSAGGWELVYDGMGNQYQIVTNVVSHSPTRSLQLWGQDGWSANVQKTFASTSEVIGYEAYMRAESNTGPADNVASMGFWNLAGAPWGKRFAVVYFDETGIIYTAPLHLGPVSVSLGPYEANRWYKFRVIIDRSAATYDVWIDDSLAASDIGITDTHEINAMMLASGHAGIKAYFDDVKVFETAQGGLVGYWKFDEGSGNIAHDSSGNGNDGTTYTATWVDGQVGKALWFNGIGSYVSIPDSSSLDIAGNQMSVEFWVKFDNPIDGSSPYMKFYDKGNAYNSAMRETGNIRFTFWVAGDSSANLDSSRTSWLAGTWYHIAEVYDGNVMSIYVNGALDNSMPMTGNIASTTYPIALGAYTLGGQWFLQGAMDEFKIYSYARTAAEIQEDCNVGLIVGYWKFDEGTGTITRDSSGNGHDGTVYGATWTNGISNMALQFDGLDDYAEVPSSPSFSSFNQLTLQAWIKADTLGMTKGYIIAKSDGYAHPDPNDEYGLFLAGRDLNFHVADGGSGYLVFGTATDAIDQAGIWYFVAAVWSGATYTIYVNGNPVKTGTASSGISSSGSAPVTMGQIGHWSWTYFDGAIDEVKIYNYARTTEDIMNDYESGDRLIEGIQTMVELNDFRAKDNIGFSIQQNFEIALAGSLTHRYWAQNVIEVDYELVQTGPGIGYSNIPIMRGLFEIYESQDGGQTFPFENRKVWWRTTISPKNLAKDSLTLRSVIESNVLWMENDFTKFSYALPEGSFIIVLPRDIASTVPQFWDSPEIIFVGHRSFAGSTPSSVSFEAGTSGNVENYVRIGSGQMWLPTKNIVRSRGDGATHSAEWSEGLNWSTDGYFQHSVGVMDQGLFFAPNLEEAIVPPPTTPVQPSYSKKAFFAEVRSPVNLNFFDSLGRHVGYNATIGDVEVNIPRVMFFFSDQGQCMMISEPNDTYELQAVGTGNGDYVLTIWWRNETGGLTVISNSSGFITEGETLAFSLSTIPEPLVISWEYIFKDNRRGTILKINIDDKYFQFVAPSKDFGVKHDLKMKVLNHVIMICYQDSKMYLAAMAIDDRIDSCVATAYDKQTRKFYLLIDKPNFR